MSTELRNFLALSYDELEELNLKAKEERRNRVAPEKIREERLKYLFDEKRIKALTVLFSDLEGRLHMLDYDKKFLLKSWDNLTFYGSSIRGFTAQRESDLRLGIDWSAFYWAPADVFGSGLELLGARQVRAVLAAFPRGDFNRQFRDLLVDHCQRKPFVQRGTWLEGLCRAHNPNLVYPDLESRLLSAHLPVPPD